MIREGARADLVLFDPERIGSDHATLVADLPGGSARLTAGSQGVRHVFVNGVETATDNARDRRDAGRGAALRARHRDRRHPLTPPGGRAPRLPTMDRPPSEEPHEAQRSVGRGES